MPLITTTGGGSVRGLGRGRGRLVADWDYRFNPSDIAAATWTPLYTNTSLETYIGMAVEPGGRRVHIARYGEDKLVTLSTTSGDAWATSGWTQFNEDSDWLPGLSGSNGNYGHISYWSSGSRASLLSVDGGDYFDLSMATPYDLRTVNLVSHIDLDMFGVNIAGSGGGFMFLDETGTKGFAKGYNTDNTMAFGSWSVPGQAGSVNWTSTAAQTDFSIASACMSPDYRFVYDIQYSTGKVYCIDAGEGNSLFSGTISSITNSGSTALGNGFFSSIGTLNIDWENLAGLVGKRRAFIWTSGQKTLYYADINLP